MMAFVLSGFIVVLWIYYAFVVSVVGEHAKFEEITESPELCRSLDQITQNCSMCLARHPSCAWCTSQLFGKEKDRTHCDTESHLRSNGCNGNSIVNPISKEDQSQFKNDRFSEKIQLKPQKLVLNTRPRHRVTFHATYKQATDFPIDVYFLSDFSGTMTDDQKTLANLAYDLANKLRSLSSKARIGFGSFADKAISPFANTKYCAKLKPSEKHKCAYSFKHHLSLYNVSDDGGEKFKYAVESSSTSGSADEPESGLDAMMQVLACQDKIGWRDYARKIIVYSTDAPYHSAGDGKFAGIIRPNDASCHLIREDQTTGSKGSTSYIYDKRYADTTDYPSIGQIHAQLRKTETSVIFAIIGPKVAEFYQSLADDLLEVPAFVGSLKADSSNIVDLVERQYLTISRTVELALTASSPDLIDYTIQTKCPNEKEFQTTKGCSNVSAGAEVQFSVSLEVKKASKKPITVKINPIGLKEYIDVTLNVLSECSCETEKQISDKCSNRGHMVCGICDCYSGYEGRQCECTTGQTLNQAMEDMCRKEMNSAICEGHGECICGLCECSKDEHSYTGKFCECDNFKCPRGQDGQLCSGHGNCVCGVCECDFNYNGELCDCYKGTDLCVGLNGEMCSGNGVCSPCGKCQCRRKYSGRTCEKCQTCPSECDLRKRCVLCADGTDFQKADDCENCPFDYIVVDDLPEKNSSMVRCDVDVGGDCVAAFLFLKNETSQNQTLWIKKFKECKPSLAILTIAGIVLGIIATIVAIGFLLLLLFKICLVIHDRREYAKFEKEAKNAKFGPEQNPLYKPASTVHENPRYRPSQFRPKAVPQLQED